MSEPDHAEPGGFGQLRLETSCLLHSESLKLSLFISRSAPLRTLIGPSNLLVPLLVRTLRRP